MLIRQATTTQFLGSAVAMTLLAVRPDSTALVSCFQSHVAIPPTTQIASCKIFSSAFGFTHVRRRAHGRPTHSFLASGTDDSTSNEQQDSIPASMTATKGNVPSSASSDSRVDLIRAEADEALAKVGWSMPEDGALTADDPFVQAIDAGIQRDVGVPLEELLNPAKVVNLERDLYNLRSQLANLTGRSNIFAVAVAPEISASITTEQVDGGGGGEEADNVRKTIFKKEADLMIERRAVFRGWLKNIFLAQAVVSFGLSYVMATNPASLFGGFGWYNIYNMDVSIQVLGYWWWWLFVIPSLRSRRPKGNEKKALDIAFLASPLVSLIAPVATRDTGLIWTANLVIVAASFAFAYLIDSDEDGDDSESKSTPDWLKFVYKSLDFGSGRERGARN